MLPGRFSFVQPARLRSETAARVGGSFTSYDNDFVLNFLTNSGLRRRRIPSGGTGLAGPTQEEAAHMSKRSVSFHRMACATGIAAAALLAWSPASEAKVTK